MHAAYVCALGAAVQTTAFTSDPALAPHVARFVADDRTRSLLCLDDWHTAADTALLQGASSLANPHVTVLARVCKKGGQHILSDEIDRGLCLQMVGWKDERNPDSFDAAIARRARIYSGCGGKHTSGALMATTSRVNQELAPGLRSSFATFAIQQQLDLPLTISTPFRDWSTCPCCGTDISNDSRGHHVLSCPQAGSAGRRARHQDVVFAMTDLLRAVGSACSIGPNAAGVPIDASSGQAPDILEYDVVMGGYPVASDVSIVTACSQAPTQKAKLLNAATWPALRPDLCPAICHHRESTKSKKYAAICHRNEWTFQPLVFSDISGAPGPATLRHVQAMAKSCRDCCDPWMFWIRFRQISAAVSIGTFHLARSIRAEMLSKDRQNGPKRTAKEKRRMLRQPAPSECTGNANSRSLDCPEQYRNTWFTNVPGPEHAQLLDDRLGEAAMILLASASTAAACLPAVANMQRVAANVRAARLAVLAASQPAPAAPPSAQPSVPPITSPPLSPVVPPQAVQPQNKNSLASTGQFGDAPVCVNELESLSTSTERAAAVKENVLTNKFAAPPPAAGATTADASDPRPEAPGPRIRRKPCLGAAKHVSDLKPLFRRCNDRTARWAFAQLRLNSDMETALETVARSETLWFQSLAAGGPLRRPLRNWETFHDALNAVAAADVEGD
jgi:hypothetical protein